MAKLLITWDDEAQAGYLYLRNNELGKVANTVAVPDDPRFLVDFSENGRPIGIEFLSDVPVSELMRVADRYATKFRGEIITDWFDQ